MKSWPSKDPDNIWDYPLSWLKQMTKDVDTIASYTVLIEPEGELEVDTDDPAHGTDFTDTTTVVWLKGGVAGSEYVVTNRVVTADGRSYDVSRKLKIKEL